MRQIVSKIFAFIIAVSVVMLTLLEPLDLTNQVAIAAAYNFHATTDVSAGDVVVWDSSAALAVKTTNGEESLLVAGVSAETISAGKDCTIRQDGGRVKINVVGDVTKGQWLVTSTTTGKAKGIDALQKGIFARALTDAQSGAGENYVYASLNLGFLGYNAINLAPADLAYLVTQMDDALSDEHLHPNTGSPNYDVKHDVSDVDGLQSSLDAKADSGHTHTEGEITDLDHDAEKVKGKEFDDTGIDDGKIWKYNASSQKWEISDDTGAAGGEVNTASNLGSGVGIFEQKAGLDLQFNSLKGGSDRITVSEDDPNNEIEVDINEGNLSHQNLSGAGSNTHTQIDSHIADIDKHREINDGGSGSSDLWSASRILQEISNGGGAVNDGLTLAIPLNESLNGRSYSGDIVGATFTGCPTAIYHFETGSGSTVYDSSGNNHNGTITGAQWEPDGKFGAALDFEAGDSQDQVSLPSGCDTSGLTEWTVGGWVKFESTGIVHGIFSSGYWETLLYVNASNNVVHLYHDGSSSNSATHFGGISAGVWTFIVGTCDGTTIKIYVNDNSPSSGSAGAAVRSTSTNVFIGSQSGAGWWMDGMIDEFFLIKGTALSDEEVKALYEMGRWRNSFYADGRFGAGYMALTGNSLYYGLSDSYLWKTAGAIDLWFIPFWDGNDGVEHYVFDSAISAAANRIRCRKTSVNNLEFEILDNESGGKVLSLAVTDANLPKNVAAHLSVSWDNGDLDGKLNGTSMGAASGGGTGNLTRMPVSLYIGRPFDVQDNELKGIIDDVKVYSRALSASEKSINYNTLWEGR